MLRFLCHLFSLGVPGSLLNNTGILIHVKHVQSLVVGEGAGQSADSPLHQLRGGGQRRHGGRAAQGPGGQQGQEQEEVHQEEVHAEDRWPGCQGKEQFARSINQNEITIFCYRLLYNFISYQWTGCQGRSNSIHQSINQNEITILSYRLQQVQFPFLSMDGLTRQGAIQKINKN